MAIDKDKNKKRRGEKGKFLGILYKGLDKPDKHNYMYTKDELKQLKLRGGKLKRNHKSDPLGEIIHHFTKDEKLWILGQFDLSTEEGRKAYQDVIDGKLKDLSIAYEGYRFGDEDSPDWQLVDKQFTEASVCEKGKIEGTHIFVTNSSKGKTTEVPYKRRKLSQSVEVIQIVNSTSEKKIMTDAPPQAQEQPNTVPADVTAEMTRLVDELAQMKETLKKKDQENGELGKKASEYDKQQEAARLAYIEQQKPILERHLAFLKEKNKGVDLNPEQKKKWTDFSSTMNNPIWGAIVDYSTENARIADLEKSSKAWQTKYEANQSDLDKIKGEVVQVQNSRASNNKDVFQDDKNTKVEGADEGKNTGVSETDLWDQGMVFNTHASVGGGQNMALSGVFTKPTDFWQDSNLY